MSESSSVLNDHILIPRGAIPADRVLSFDLFVKVGEKFVKVANANEPIDESRIQRYLGQGQDILYIDRSGLERFMDEKFATMFENVENVQLSIGERFQWFIRALELCYIDLKIVKISPDKFMRVNLLIDAGFTFFKSREIRKILVRDIFKYVNHPLSKRAILGTALMLNMFLDQNEGIQNTYRSLFIGALFRDFSMRSHAEDPHLQTLITDREAEEDFYAHPTKSLEMLKAHNQIDDIIQAMVEQHHERPRGDGFPRNLNRVEIFPPAQYLNLCDTAITELEKRKASGKMAVKDEFLDHLKEVLPEEDRKNLPILLRAVGDIF